jgi:opacity protein-like surface antigen
MKTIRQLVYLGLLVGVCSVSYSQVFGISGGLNSANGKLSSTEFSIANSVDVSSRSSFFVGAYLEFRLEIDDQFADHAPDLRNRLFLQVGVRYQENGFEMINSPFLANNLELKIGQLNVPFFLKYIIFDELAVKLGGYGAVFMKIEETYNNITYNAKEQNENLGGGALLGLEYEIGDHFVFEARYHFSGTRLTLNSPYIGSHKFQSQFLQVGIGVKFD